MKSKQIQIEFHKLAANKVAVERILLMAANKFDLYDNTDTSRVPDTIKSIVEGKGFGFGLGARVLDNLILIDFNPRPNASPKFYDVYGFILAALLDAFPGQLNEVPEDDPAYCKTYQ